MLNHPASSVFGALGDSTRRAIIQQLSDGPASVSDIARPLGISRSAVLQHLTVLEESELVTSRKTGRTRTCSLNPAGLSVAQTWLEQHRERWEQRLDRLGSLLSESTSGREEQS